MIRVLTVIDSLAIGGAEKSLATVAPHLIDRGVELHVGYIRERDGVAGALSAAGVTLHSLAGSESWVPAIRRTRSLLSRVRPDIVHTTLYRADIIGRSAAALSRIPSVSSFVTESYGPEHYDNPEYRRWKVRGAHFADAATARLVSRFHAVSHAAAKAMAQRLHIKPSKIAVIPRGRDPSVLGRRTAARRAAGRKSLGISDEVPVVFAAARHYQVKGLDIAVEAFAGVLADFPEARLVIAGRSGPATPDLRRIIDERGLDHAVDLIDYRDDVPELMCAADIVVLPSRAEGSPGVLIEAMALEVPTVASAIPSVVEVAATSRPTSRLFPLDAPDEMAQAIIGILQHPEDARAMAAAAREKFERHYSIDAVATATVALYVDVLENR